MSGEENGGQTNVKNLIKFYENKGGSKLTPIKNASEKDLPTNIQDGHVKEKVAHIEKRKSEVSQNKNESQKARKNQSMPANFGNSDGTHEDEKNEAEGDAVSVDRAQKENVSNNEADLKINENDVGNSGVNENLFVTNNEEEREKEPEEDCPEVSDNEDMGVNDDMENRVSYRMSSSFKSPFAQQKIMQPEEFQIGYDNNNMSPVETEGRSLDLKFYMFLQANNIPITAVRQFDLKGK